MEHVKDAEHQYPYHSRPSVSRLFFKLVNIGSQPEINRVSHLKPFPKDVHDIRMVEFRVDPIPGSSSEFSVNYHKIWISEYQTVTTLGYPIKM
jgi:hypothetical protein